MFCCCSRDSTSYALEEVNPDNSKVPKPDTISDTNIQTGKGALSTSNQDLRQEATLDKATINSARREKQQPTESNQVSDTAQEPKPEEGHHSASKEQEGQGQAVSESDIKAQIILPASSEPNQSPSSDQSNPKISSSRDPLAPLLCEIGDLEKAVTEAESEPEWKAKSSVPQLAHQVRALTSQVQQTAVAVGATAMSEQSLQAAVSRLEAVATRLESLAVGGGAGTSTDEVAPFIVAYDDILNGSFAKFISLCSAIGGDVTTQSEIVKAAFDAERNFLVIASKSKMPDQNTLMELLKPLSEKISATQSFREDNRRSLLFNHLSTLSESITALGWVTVSPTPGPYIKEAIEAGRFYSNRVLKDMKDKDSRHVDWVHAWTAVLNELMALVKQFHTTGISWNAQGGDAKAVKSPAQSAAAPPPPGGAPPPPPPPPPPSADLKTGGDDSGADKTNALFAEINQGFGVTKGLRKVTDDMKTHKNPALRQGPAPFKPAPSAKPSPSPKPAAKVAAAPARPPVFELQGKKWIVEYQKGNQGIVIQEGDVNMSQTVYVYKCENSVIQVQGKVNSITLDSCKKMGVVFTDVVSTVEFVNCQSVKGQSNGVVPTISIDKTDGCQVFLNEKCLDVQIVTAKSSEMNITVPDGTDGDIKEFPLPEQFKSEYDGKKFVTTCLSMNL